jgi:shikimate 5-dehydrogenase
MHPNVDASPFAERPPKLSSENVVFDTIYNPMETKLLKQAKAAGAKTIGGVEMFIQQAGAQFQAWTGIGAPMAVMREALVKRLNS